ncbi:MAG: hypothetical protein IKI79_02995 [Erysipelotrichaceae bacterium]|nr:hypothetical protein [Erysipelotrichaceae bacterium]MBQ1911788.1 hypothetical protein [Erysipelotrichaceae bacterium]MBQ2078403.1 hypothetical protein [Erysipelotrichaceae bacterium]MBQ2233420.1 hypothetical protein [Erysipelotrichaceae bacterium]MBQ2656158.1 hypothetical protein [Erysipelotrichaceae bacterium]
MGDTKKDISEKVEQVMRESITGDKHIEIPLYERRKGKEFHASGSWKATEGEKRIIESFGYMAFFGIFIGLIMLFIFPGKLASIILAIGIIGAVGTFVSLFAIVLHKHKQEPMEAHYYDTDYKYNAFTKEETDHSKEITKEEFFGKK